MAPLLFALALLAQDTPAANAATDGPVATAVPRKQTAAPLPIQGGPVSAPTDDYGYVGWCYGVIAGYIDLYDLAMPEVTRIERAWPTPSTEENIKVIYPGQRDEGKRNLVTFRRAMEAAEKASPSPIQDQGAAAIKRGRAVWSGSTNVPRAQLAQFWMSWTPPAKCEQTAKALETRSNLFGQALSYNVDTPQAEATAPVATPTPAPAKAAKAAEAPVAEPAAVTIAPAPPPAVEPAPVVAQTPVVDTPLAEAAPPAPTPPTALAATPPPEPATIEQAPSASGKAQPTASRPVVAPTPPVKAAAAIKVTPAAEAPVKPKRKYKRGLRDVLGLGKSSD
ncbi:MAG: hypothetical protein Q8L66_15650 [Caulobacter sp.]|nr:hypothetical protein [Caulobacter sp.]